MKIVEKPWKYGTRLAYEDIEPELLEFKPDIRVLPASSYYEKNVMFTFIARYEPGEKKTFPEGGFEVRGPGGDVRSFYLDQVVIHPFVIRHRKMVNKVRAKDEKQQAKIDKRLARMDKLNKIGTGKRGRPSLSPEEKAIRDAEKANKPVSTGKRGRPTLDPSQRKPQYVAKGTGTGRGRPALSPEEKAKREAEQAAIKAAKALISGGKRGRPKKK